MEQIKSRINLWQKEEPGTLLDLSGLGIEEWGDDLIKIARVVTKLDISNNHFKEIPKLPMCEKLIASKNDIIKVGTMPKIVDLDLRFNKITKLPGMTKARKILVSDNKLVNMPKTVNNLEILDVSNNINFTKLPPKLPKVRVLLCSNCDLSSIPDTPKLEIIRYFGNSDLELNLPKEVKIIMKDEELVLDDILTLDLEPTKKSPKSTKKSPKSTKISQKLTKKSPKSTKISPKSTKISPKSTKISPKSTKISPKSTKISPKKTLKPTIIPEDDFEDEDFGLTPTKKEMPVTNIRKKTPKQKFVVKKEARIEEINLWDQIPKTFGPISFIALTKIETDIEAPVKPKKIKNKLEIPIEIEVITETLPDEEIDISEEEFDNINKFMTDFDITYMPRPGVRGKNRYGPADLREFMKLLGLSSSGYNDDKIRIISEYIRLTDVLKLPLDPKDNENRDIIVKVLRIRKKGDESDYEAIIGWQNKQIAKIDALYK